MSRWLVPRFPTPALMTSFRRWFAALAVVSLLSLAAQAEPDIIGKARAYLGSEDALNAVTSVHFVGSIARDNPADPAHPIHGTIDIVVAKPYKFHVILTSDKVVEVDGLNGYDGWHRHEDRLDPSKWAETVAGVGAIHQMRANIWQNLAFYRQIDSDGPQIVDKGTVTSNGVLCREVSFIHDAKTTFNRFFDEATGRLVFTASGSGGEIREEGELRAGGIRFPKKLITTFAGGPGKVQVVTLEFSTITVNEVFPDSLFAPPPPLPRTKS